jgi:hypothetical protein
MEKFSQNIIDKIKAEHLAPRPRWRFLVLDAWWWLLLLLAVGSLIFAVIFFNLHNNDWSIYTTLGTTFIGKLWLTLPYLWLISLLALAWLASREIALTRRAYRYNLSLVLALGLATSFFTGSLLYSFGISDDIEEFLISTVPQYEQFKIHGSGLWDQPQIGFLAGTIVAIADSDNFLLKDVDNEIWIIQGRQVAWLASARPRIGSLVKIVGFQVDREHFVAKEVRVWNP